MSGSRTKEGIILAALAFTFWGVIALYWKLLGHLSSWELLFHRMLWGIIPLIVYLALSGKWRGLVHLREKKALFYASMAAILIIINWVIFIWAVSNGHVLEVSLGYFLNPLLNVVLGTIFLGEKLRRKQQAAVALAGVGLAVMFAQELGAPWISLALACSFSLYGLVRKKSPLSPAQGLFFEMLAGVILMTPLMGSYIPFVFSSLSWSQKVLAALAGPVTIFPLILFNRAVKLINYSTVGILQYLAPTLQFLLAVLVFNEHFTLRHGLAFTLIWIAVILYLFETLSKTRRNRHNKEYEA